VVTHVIQKGIIQEIIGSQTQTRYDQTGKLIVSAISLHLRFEISDGIFKKILFNGYLPSNLIGKNVNYIGEAIANQAEGRKITQKFILYHPYRMFLAHLHDQANRQELSEQELKSILIQDYP